MKNLIFKYRGFSKAIVMFILLVFCFSSFAADSHNCICNSKQEVKKEMKCCNVKKESSCCNKEKSCGSHNSGGKKDCSHCTIKKSDIENPFTTNDSKLVKSVNTNLTDETISLSVVNRGLLTFNSWRPPDKTSRIYLALSNFRI